GSVETACVFQPTFCVRGHATWFRCSEEPRRVYLCRLFSCARLLCHSHAVEMMSSSSVMCGLHCNSLAARAELLISRAGSPGRLSPNFTGTENPVTRSTDAITSRTE